MKDTTFYNAESARYSSSRYPKQSITFTQFFFKKRLAIVLNEIGKITNNKKELSLLEVGCADGVVVRAVWERYAAIFKNILAIDIAPQMIGVASKHNKNTSIAFSVRTDVALPGAHDLILEVGVLNFANLEEELRAVSTALVPGGRYICSLSSTTSLQNRLKGASGYRHLKSYKEYEAELCKYFVIEHVQGVGAFIPWLWKLPALARVVQPLADALILTTIPNLSHEKVYVLTAKN
jgi:hypothetical protein